MINSKVSISEKALIIMQEDSKKAFPNECCGFMYGNEKDGRFIDLAIPVNNSKVGDQRRRFEISPFDYMKAEQYAIENETQLLGVYHSHPNHPAIASETDRSKAMPYFSYVIISILDGKIDDVKSWKLKEETRIFEEEDVSILENHVV